MVPLAEQRKIIQTYDDCGHRRFCGCGVVIWLRCGQRFAATATTAASSSDRGRRDATERIGSAGEPGDVYGDGQEHNGHRCQLER